jgi:hypothetical protein
MRHSPSDDLYRDHYSLLRLSRVPESNKEKDKSDERMDSCQNLCHVEPFPCPILPCLEDAANFPLMLYCAKKNKFQENDQRTLLFQQYSFPMTTRQLPS